MGILKFKNDSEFKELICSTHISKEHRSTYGKKPIPSLWLVHDDGVYLMSSAIMAKGQKTANLIYAEGCNPNIDEDYYSTASTCVGGDDFADALPLDLFDHVLSSEKKTFQVIVSSSSIEIKS